MSLYLGVIERLAWASFAGAVSLCVALLICRYTRIDALAKVWLLRIALLSNIVQLFSLALPLPLSPPTTQPVLNYPLLCGLIGAWLAGVFLAAQHFLQGYRTAIRLRSCSKSRAPHELEKIADQLARRLGVRHRLSIRVSESIQTVLLIKSCGFAILIPSVRENCEGLELAIAHEVAHIKHRDIEWSSLAMIVQLAFWFNPLVRWSANELRLQSEIAADLLSIKLMAPQARTYAEMLVRFSSPAKPPFGATAVSAHRDLAVRVRELYSKRTGFVTQAIVVLVGLLFAVPVKLPSVQFAESPRRMLSPDASEAGLASPVRLAARG